jgi:hypothetical protein
LEAKRRRRQEVSQEASPKLKVLRMLKHYLYQVVKTMARLMAVMIKVQLK